MSDTVHKYLSGFIYALYFINALFSLVIAFLVIGHTEIVYAVIVVGLLCFISINVFLDFKIDARRYSPHVYFKLGMFLIFSLIVLVCVFLLDLTELALLDIFSIYINVIDNRGIYFVGCIVISALIIFTLLSIRKTPPQKAGKNDHSNSDNSIPKVTNEAVFGITKNISCKRNHRKEGDHEHG